MSKRLQTGGGTKASESKDEAKDPKASESKDDEDADIDAAAEGLRQSRHAHPVIEQGAWVPTCQIRYRSTTDQKFREEGPWLFEGSERRENVVRDLGERDARRFAEVGAIRPYYAQRSTAQK